MGDNMISNIEYCNTFFLFDFDIENLFKLSKYRQIVINNIYCKLKKTRL